MLASVSSITGQSFIHGKDSLYRRQNKTKRSLLPSPFGLVEDLVLGIPSAPQVHCCQQWRSISLEVIGVYRRASSASRSLRYPVTSMMINTISLVT